MPRAGWDHSLPHRVPGLRPPQPARAQLRCWGMVLGRGAVPVVLSSAGDSRVSMTTHPHGFPPSGTLPAWAGSAAHRPPGTTDTAEEDSGSVTPAQTPGTPWREFGRARPRTPLLRGHLAPAPNSEAARGVVRMRDPGEAGSCPCATDLPRKPPQKVLKTRNGATSARHRLSD